MDYTLVIVGALAALAGLYFQAAPSEWWLAHFSEAYQYGAYTLGGVLLGTGFGVYAERNFDETGRSTRVSGAATLATVAVAGAVAAALLWIR
ncbi:MAG TPA: hypothetical protein VL330_05480 [Actinomycetes bacterium]|nr:hypothetical protein [Actinomycetes bacterium]